MLGFKLAFYTALADTIHGIRYALVPALDWAWRKKDAAMLDLEMRRNGDERS